MRREGQPVWHSGHGAPLAEYTLTRRDRADQRAAESIREHADQHHAIRRAEEAADPDLRERRLQAALDVLSAILSEPQGPLTRWRVRLYCGHIAETSRHASVERPNMHGSWSMRCPECGKEPSLIVAWEPIDAPASKDPALGRQAVAKLESPSNAELGSVIRRVWVSVAEASTYTGIGQAELYEALQTGDLRGTQRVKGGKWRIHIQDLDPWMRGGK